MDYKFEDIKIPGFDLSGKVAVITGGTKGLGYGMALTLAKYGADVVVASRTAADCERVSAEIREHFGRRSLGIPTDVADPAQNEALVQKTVQELGRIDIMICNAGVASTVRAVDMTVAQWDEVMDIDLKGVFFSAQAAAKAMIKQGEGGRILFTGSAGAFSGSPGISHYCAAKAGVVHLGRALAVEWARYKITVNSICPGYVPTGINEEVMQNEKALNKIVQHAALRRLGTVDEVAAAVLYMVSDAAAYMTGSYLLVDGGGTAS